MPNVPAKQVTTAAVYVPVSVEGENQEKKLMELCQYAFEKKWRLVEYRERLARAKTRPVFSEMMRHARQGQFEVVLVHSLDCFARSLRELWATVTALKPFKIRFVSFRERIEIDQETWDGCIYLYMLNALMKAEKSMNTRNVQAGIARAQMSGVPCGRPRRRFAVAEARKLRQQGLSFRAIAARIGVPASTVADALRDESAKT